jgi:serine/threonine protein kinase
MRRLKRAGYVVTAAENGAKALELIDNEKFHLVLLDILMPGLSGIDVLQAVRIKYSLTELPIIMATAVDDTEEVVKALDLGANDYVIKPFDFPIVLARIKTHLRMGEATPATVSLNTVSVDTTTPQLLIGEIIDKKYKLESVIGMGGFGAVFQAEHLSLHQPVAIKILQTSLLTTSQDIMRFRREAVSACSIKHKNAVKVMDIDSTNWGSPYLVMELLIGETVADLLRLGGRISAKRSLEVLIPVADLLTEVHEEGIVHRDLKPSNIFLHQEEGEEIVKVVDFGLAKAIDQSLDSAKLTGTGELLGTPAYMAPERLRNKEYDGKADMYSVGIMLYEMLTGEVPFLSREGDKMAVAMMQINDDPIPLRAIQPDIPHEIEDIVSRLLQKQPEQRPSAKETLEAFQQLDGIIDEMSEQDPDEMVDG